MSLFVRLKTMWSTQKNIMKYKFALVGRNISHSRSPNIYRKLLGPQLEKYELLDYNRLEDIPPLSELLAVFDGINITAPYKEISKWNDKVNIIDVPPSLGVFNVAKKDNKQVFVSNTDFMALENILPELVSRVSGEVIILGDGAMSKVTQVILKESKVAFSVLSRKSANLFSDMDLRNFGSKGSLVINTCSRSFLFKGKVPERSIFYDYNYDNTEQAFYFNSSKITYLDGQDLLVRQAKLALKFWHS